MLLFTFALPLESGTVLIFSFALRLVYGSLMGVVMICFPLYYNSVEDPVTSLVFAVASLFHHLSSSPQLMIL